MILSSAIVLPAVQASMLVVAVVTAPPDSGTSFWALAATTFLTFAFQAFREWRDRKWKQEDAVDRSTIARLTQENTDLIARNSITIKQMSAMLGQKIDDNTMMNKESLDASNHMATKMVQTQETVADAAKVVALAADTVAKARLP